MKKTLAEVGARAREASRKRGREARGSFVAAHSAGNIRAGFFAAEAWNRGPYFGVEPQGPARWYGAGMAGS